LSFLAFGKNLPAHTLASMNRASEHDIRALIRTMISRATHRQAIRSLKQTDLK